MEFSTSFIYRLILSAGNKPGTVLGMVQGTSSVQGLDDKTRPVFRGGDIPRLKVDLGRITNVKGRGGDGTCLSISMVIRLGNISGLIVGTGNVLGSGDESGPVLGRGDVLGLGGVATGDLGAGDVTDLVLVDGLGDVLGNLLGLVHRVVPSVVVGVEEGGWYSLFVHGAVDWDLGGMRGQVLLF